MAYNLTPIEKILIEPVKYYKELKGKDIRKILCQNLGEKLLIQQNEIDKIDDFINTIHIQDFGTHAYQIMRFLFLSILVRLLYEIVILLQLHSKG